MTSLLQSPKRKPFEGVDLAAAGRRGGKERWRKAQLEKELEPLRKQEALEQKIFDGNNRQAQEALLRRWERRNRKLEDARVQADETVLRLMDDADAERATIARLLEQTRELEAQVQALEARRLALDSDESIATLLVEIGEERLERVLDELGWIDDDETVMSDEAS